MVQNPIPVRSGTVGPLKSKDGKESYGGGAHQYEILQNMKNDEWKKYFEIIDSKELK